MALTIAQARELLGPDGDDLSDEEVESILASISWLASELLDRQVRGEL